MEKSSLKLVSNIMLKSKFDQNHTAYLPFDMLSRASHDSRLSDRLSGTQYQQKLKRLFMATKVKRDDSDELESEEQQQQ